MTTNLNFYHMERIAVPQPSIIGNISTKDPIIAAIDIKHISDIREKWIFYWSFNRAVAEAYGLTPDDFEYILSTFPVFARKRPEFYAYLKRRIAEWKEEGPRVKPAVKDYLIPEGREVQAAAESRSEYKTKCRKGQD